MKIFLRWLLLFITMSLLTACASSTQSGLTGVKRSQLQIISAEDMNASSKQQYMGLINEAKQQGVIDRSSKTAKRVNTVFKKLTPYTRNFRPDANEFEWEMNVIRSNELNAFAMPGGKMVVYSGIVEKLNLSDDEIAAIVGH